MNRIDEFADALTGWLNEYAEKQKTVYKFGAERVDSPNNLRPRGESRTAMTSAPKQEGQYAIDHTAEAIRTIGRTDNPDVRVRGVSAMDGSEQGSTCAKGEAGFSADDNLSEQVWADYEAAIRMSPHPECCACEDCNLKHKFEEES